MISWIVLGLIVYLLIGVGLLIWSVTSDMYGGFVLHYWWLIVFFYPILIVRSLFNR